MTKLDKFKMDKKLLHLIFLGLVSFGLGFSLNYLLTDIPVPVSEPPVPDRFKLEKSIAYDIGYARLEFTDLYYHWPNDNRSWIFFPQAMPVSYDMDHFNLSNWWVLMDYWVALISHPGDDIYVKIELLWYIPAFVKIESIGSINQTLFFDSYYAQELDEAWAFYFWHGDDWATIYNSTNPITNEKESYWVPNYHSFFVWGYYHLIPK